MPQHVRKNQAANPVFEIRVCIRACAYSYLRRVLRVLSVRLCVCVCIYIYALYMSMCRVCSQNSKEERRQVAPDTHAQQSKNARRLLWKVHQSQQWRTQFGRLSEMHDQPNARLNVSPIDPILYPYLLHGEMRLSVPFVSQSIRFFLRYPADKRTKAISADM